MAEKKYVGAEALIRLIAQLKAGFSQIGHKHTTSDIEDYTVDSSLSSTSTNPVQNKAIKAEFQSVESAIASKADKSDLTSGTVVVKEAEHADTADSATTATTATNANHATTADSATSATTATSAGSATKATQDASGNVITSTYETKSDASAKLASAKAYTDEQIDALDYAASSHSHAISDVTNLQSELDSLESAISGKAASSHSHTITANASDDDVVVLTGTNGSNAVTYSASHANSGVTAGTYKSVTVNAKGHVTGGSNPTTISGYGITDAYTKAQVDSALSGKAAASHSHDDLYYTESEIDAKFDAIIGEGASETLDTIGEISAAIEDNQDMLDTLNNAIGSKQDTITGGATTITSSNLTASRALVSNSSGKVAVSAVTSTELGYLDGVTSNIQSQLDDKSDSDHTHTITANASDDDIVVLTGTNGTNAVTYKASHATSGATAGSYGDSSAQTPAHGGSFKVPYVTVNATGHVTGISAHNVTLPAAQTLTGLGVTATAAELNKLDGVTATTAEINYLDGVTSAIQSQLDSKSASGHTHNYAGSSSAGGSATSAEKLATARTIALTGDVAGSASFDGSGDASISTSVTSMHGVTASSDDGVAYTATVSGITALTAGVSFIMIPSRDSASTTPTLNVNGLGAKGIRMRGSTATGTAMTASIAAWLASGIPVQVTYNGVYWVSEVTRPAASDLSGTIGTAQIADGAVTASKLDPSLGLVSVSDTEPTDGQVFLWIQV